MTSLSSQYTPRNGKSYFITLLPVQKFVVDRAGIEVEMKKSSTRQRATKDFARLVNRLAVT